MDRDEKGSVRPRYLRVSYTGEPEAREVLNVLRGAVKSAVKSEARGIILDLTDTECSLSWADRIIAGTAVAALQSNASRQIPIAIVVPGTDVDPRKLGTKAAARRGGRLDAFTSLEAARAWLRTQ